MHYISFMLCMKRNHKETFWYVLPIDLYYLLIIIYFELLSFSFSLINSIMCFSSKLRIHSDMNASVRGLFIDSKHLCTFVVFTVQLNDYYEMNWNQIIHSFHALRETKSQRNMFSIFIFWYVLLIDPCSVLYMAAAKQLKLFYILLSC